MSRGRRRPPASAEQAAREREAVVEAARRILEKVGPTSAAEGQYLREARRRYPEAFRQDRTAEPSPGEIDPRGR